MSVARSILLLMALLLPVFGGCTLKNGAPPIQIDEGLVLEDTPFYPQQQYQCGPASLAMLLSASGVMVSPEILAPSTYLPGRRGSLQLELQGACRQYNRIPYVLPPDFAAIVGELRFGRPVLVLQNLGLNILPVYHYAVVIGMVPPDRVVLRSGKNRRLVMDLDHFLRTWQKRSDSWAMIVLRPGELPANPDPVRYIEAVSAFESNGHPLPARQSYMAAQAAWPTDQTTLFALGNNYLSLHQHHEAEAVFRQLILLNPGHIAAANNLADTLAKRGCYTEAYDLANRAALVAKQQHSPYIKTLQQTEHEIARHLLTSGHSQENTCKPILDTPWQ